MSEGDEQFERASDAPARDYGSVALAFACAVAVVLATALVPAASSVGTGGAPAESLVPLPPGAEGESEGGGTGSGAGTGDGFGALNAGDETSVGGSLADAGGNPFRSQDTEIHFQVRSEESSYWRTAVYDTYTGDGWSRSQPSDATAPIDGRGVRYRVELAKSATSVPTVWRPTSLDEAEGIELTEGGLARANGTLSPGTSYVGQSRKPPRDPAVLRATGQDYPDDIEDRYTTLPASTAVSLRPITTNITRETDNPYESAVLIEEWLETNKEYSLNVSEPSSGNVAREFVTQMDAGYCEYFATAMTAMLRSQDIPARYVVGYSTGQQTGSNTYQVRAMNAHAWVEVYFADVGWVRFDPTPGEERLQRERAAFENSSERGTYAPQEDGSPGETFSPVPEEERSEPTGTESSTDAAGTDGGTTADGGTESPDSTPPSTPSRPDQPETPSDPDGPSSSGYDVSLNRTAVPGAAVEVSVRAGAQPVVDAVVLFNGDPVGRTDRDGVVVGTVPYSERLSVTVVGGRTVASDAPAGGATNLVDAPQSLPDPDTTGLTGRAFRENTTQTFDVATNATLSVSGDVRTGGAVLVTGTIDGVPVRNATVWVGDDRVGTTDRAGRIRVLLPESPGNVTIRLERDPIAGNRTLSLGALRVQTSPRFPLPVAGTALEVVARSGNDTVAGAPVQIGGETVGETGVDGTLTARLPFDSTVEVVIAADGQIARTTVENPLVNAAGTAIGTVFFLLGGAILVRRRSLDPRTLGRSLVASVGRVAAWTVSTFVAIAMVVAGRVERILGHLLAVLAGERSLARVLAAFRAWVTAWLDRIDETVSRRIAARKRDRGSASGGREDATASADEPHVTIRTAWGRFLGYLSIRRPKTKTPGQLAEHAVSTDGFPRDAVATLRDEFRAVEYGPRSPDESITAVERALEHIDRTVEPPDEGPAVDKVESDDRQSDGIDDRQSDSIDDRQSDSIDDRQSDSTDDRSAAEGGED